MKFNKCLKQKIKFKIDETIMFIKIKNNQKNNNKMNNQIIPAQKQTQILYNQLISVKNKI